MKKLLPILSFFCLFHGFAQTEMELTPQGFATVTIPKPEKTPEKLIEHSKNWAAYYNRNNENVYDVYSVTENALSIDTFKDNAYFYRNRGEAFQHKIKYTLKIEFVENTCQITFVVKEIYVKNILIKTTVADFFTAEGRLKDDFKEAKPSLEKTANAIVQSFLNYIRL